MVPDAHTAPRAGRVGMVPWGSNLHLSVLTDLEALGPPGRCLQCPPPPSLQVGHGLFQKVF